MAGGGTQPQEVNKKILKEAEPKIRRLQKPYETDSSSKGKARQCSDVKIYQSPDVFSDDQCQRFTVTEKCIGCGKCEQRCPMNNVKLKNNMPVWGTECTHCMACIAGCPEEAIEYGKRPRENPDIIWRRKPTYRNKKIQ